MRILSFAWTTQALTSGFKTCTRREWIQRYARGWRKGTIATAYNRSPRFKGKPVGHIKLVRDVYLERTCEIPDEDYEAEGFGWMERNSQSIQGMRPRDFFDRWRSGPGELWVVRFDLLDTCAQPMVEKEKQIELWRQTDGTTN